MPLLTYNDPSPRTGRLTGRALIGRRLSHGVALADPAVGRLHAWVDPTPEGGWAVTDAGSKTGTFVNDQPTAHRELRDGDVIRVGSSRITFHTGDDGPAAEAVALSPPPGESVRTGGILFDCACGAPIWVGHDLAGKRGRCRHCKRQVTVPVPVDAPSTAPLAPAVDRRPPCGVCHAGIAATEAMTVCPECDTTYHAECWAENHGCSTYGCGQVNALDPAAEMAVAEPELVADDAPPAPPTPWEWVAVLAAVLATAVGALSFGVPAAVMAVVAGVMIVRRRADTRVGLLALAVAVAVIGVAAGLAFSDFWFLGGRHLP